MLQQAASERHETPDQVITDALRFALQPVRQEALRRLQSQIRQQETQSDPEIRGHLEARLTEKQQQRLSELLEKNRTESLTAEEQTEIQTLFDAIEAVATEKAAAIWQLSGRIPSPDAVR